MKPPIRAPPALTQWITALTARPPQLSYDTLHTDPASQLQRALPTRQTAAFIDDIPVGALLPPAHHLVYFRRKMMLRDLGKDGSCTDLNPPAPFSRRMWAGGEFHWPPSPSSLSLSSISDPANARALKIGDPITQVLTVPKIEYKKGMVFVHQQRDLYAGKLGVDDVSDKSDKNGEGEGWAVRESRVHVFRPAEQETGASPSSPFPPLPNPAPVFTFTYTPTTPLLFLFSALTHNPHKIHYDRPWALAREKQEGVVVHGPMSAVLLVEVANAVASGEGKRMVGFEYRATGAMVVDREIVMSAWWEGEELVLQARQGERVGMKARARFV
ncbi:hypothetical protein IAR50_000931 [Cryptococcus sp. DSM 104548]